MVCSFSAVTLENRCNVYVSELADPNRSYCITLQQKSTCKEITDRFHQRCERNRFENDIVEKMASHEKILVLEEGVKELRIYIAIKYN